MKFKRYCPFSVPHPRRWVRFPVMVCLASATSLAANAAAISFTPTYDFGALVGADQTKFQASIESVLNYYSTSFGAPNALNVSIRFKADETISLGQSTTFINSVSYADYRTALVGSASSAADALSLLTMPAGVNNPVNGTPNLTTSLPLLRALGFAQGDNGGGLDSTVSLKTSLMSLDRSGAVDPAKYDLMQVALHEINEVLGLTSALSGAGTPPYNPPGGNINPVDLFRYSAVDVRSYTQDPAVRPYLSIDGGTTKLANFNQDSGGDFGDYNVYATGNPPSAQDAFSTPGIRLDNGLAETTSLDVVGYSVIPEPSSVMLLAGTFVLLGVRRRAVRG
jgi:hypothetical protein